jgi:hypothetical protein
MAQIAAEERVMSNLDTDRSQSSPDRRYHFAERTLARGSSGLVSALVALAVLGAVVVIAIKNNPAKVGPAPAAAHHASATMTKTDTASDEPTTPASTGSAQQVTGAIVATL